MNKLELQKTANESAKGSSAAFMQQRPAIRADLCLQPIFSRICILKK